MSEISFEKFKREGRPTWIEIRALLNLIREVVLCSKWSNTETIKGQRIRDYVVHSQNWDIVIGSPPQDWRVILQKGQKDCMSQRWVRTWAKQCLLDLRGTLYSWAPATVVECTRYAQEQGPQCSNSEWEEIHETQCLKKKLWIADGFHRRVSLF